MEWIQTQSVASGPVSHDGRKQRGALGYSEGLKRPKYATTSIITAMGQCDDFGAISVVHVGASMGKTTAANYFLRKNREQIRGIAICRTQVGLPYLSSMLSLLGLNALHPPNGWLSCLFDALDEPSNDGRTSVLILDEFVSAGRDDADSALLMEIKATIRNRTNIRVIVLTPSEEYASYLLSLNKLQGIVPLQGTYPIDRYPEGEWRSMHWSSITMKVAARQLPELSSLDVESIDFEIDRFYDGLSAEENKNVTLLLVAKSASIKITCGPTNFGSPQCRHECIL